MKNEDSKSGCNRIIPSLLKLMAAMNRTHKEHLLQTSRSLKGSKPQKYIQLFEYLERFISGKKDPEDLVTQLLTSGKFGKSEDLYATATYLFERIMYQIRSTPSSVAQIHNQLLQLLQDINFLFFHELYQECYRAIKQARKLAIQIDRPAYLLELHVWEVRTVSRMRKITLDLEKMKKEMDDTVANLKHTHETFLNAQQLYFSLTSTGDHIPPQTEQLMAKILTGPAENLDSFTPRLHYWKLIELQFCFDLRNVMNQKNKQESERKANLSSSLYYNRQNLDLMSMGKGKFMAEEEPVNYLSALENYLLKCIQIKNEEGIQVLDSEFLKKYTEKEDIYKYRLISFFKLSYYMRFNQFKEACDYIEEHDLETNLQSRQHLISYGRISMMRNNCTLAYFLCEHYEKALNWANTVLKTPKRIANSVVYILCDLVYTICLLETNRFSEIHTHLNKLHRKYKRRLPQNKFLHDLIVTIRYASMPLHAQFREITSQHKKYLEASMKDNDALGVYVPILAWISMRQSEEPTTLVKEIQRYDN